MDKPAPGAAGASTLPTLLLCFRLGSSLRSDHWNQAAVHLSDGHPAKIKHDDDDLF
jgi:hypothetical protein